MLLVLFEADCLSMVDLFTKFVEWKYFCYDFPVMQ